jgi:hypothetical protein
MGINNGFYTLLSCYFIKNNCITITNFNNNEVIRMKKPNVYDIDEAIKDIRKMIEGYEKEKKFLEHRIYRCTNQILLLQKYRADMLDNQENQLPEYSD